jgi:hypothetical protein
MPREHKFLDPAIQHPTPMRQVHSQTRLAELLRGPFEPLMRRDAKPTSVPARAIGALAWGALAVGAVAIGTVAIGKLVIGRVRIRRLEIDELVVRRLQVTRELSTPQPPKS